MVVKLENTNNTPITNTTTQESEAKPASMNSVMVSDQETKTSEPKETSRLTCNDFSELQPASDSNVIKTLDDFKKEVEKIFNKKGIKYSNEVLKKLIGKLPTKDELGNADCINQYLDIISKVLDKCVKNGKLDENASKLFKEYKIGLASGWTAEEFEKRNKEYSKNFNIKEAISKFEELSKKENVSKDELKKELGLILANATDEEKLELLGIVTQIKDGEITKLVFESFEHAKQKMEFADKIEYKVLNSVDEQTRHLFLMNMSAETLEKNLDRFNDEFKKFYKDNKDKIKQILEAHKSNEPVSKDLSLIEKELYQYLSSAASYQVGVNENVNISNDKKEELTKKNETLMQQDPELYNLYVSTLADYVMNNRETLNIDVDKFKNFIKKVTGNDEFSRALDSIAEQKSAVDSETNMFKIPSKETKNTAQKNAVDLSQIIKQQTQEAGEMAQQPEPVSPIEKVKTFLADKEFDTNITLFDTKEYANNTFKAVKAVFTGKVKVASQDENKALDKYKVLNSAEQEFVLESAKNSWLRKIINNTKDSVVLAFTGVGANSYATKEIENAKRNVEKK